MCILNFRCAIYLKKIPIGNGFVLIKLAVNIQIVKLLEFSDFAKVSKPETRKFKSINKQKRKKKKAKSNF